MLVNTLTNVNKRDLIVKYYQDTQYKVGPYFLSPHIVYVIHFMSIKKYLCK